MKIYLKKDKHGVLIPRGDYIVSKEEKQSIIKWMYYNHLSCTKFYMGMTLTDIEGAMVSIRLTKRFK